MNQDKIWRRGHKGQSKQGYRAIHRIQRQNEIDIGIAYDGNGIDYGRQKEKCLDKKRNNVTEVSILYIERRDIERRAKAS